MEVHQELDQQPRHYPCLETASIGGARVSFKENMPCRFIRRAANVKARSWKTEIDENGKRSTTIIRMGPS